MLYVILSIIPHETVTLNCSCVLGVINKSMKQFIFVLLLPKLNNAESAF